MSIEIDGLIEHYDGWTDRWNQASGNKTREKVISFLNDWRSEDGNWFTGGSEEFFEQVLDRSLFVDKWEWGMVGELQKLHLANHVIWHLEDEARRDDVRPERIVEIKRGIDAVNQKRNDQMEKLDEWTIQETNTRVDDEALPVHSEPPGLIFDRLSILSLKIYHYSDPAGQAKQSRLREQREDLTRALRRLWEQLEDNRCRVKIYRQFKTYNDPETNPAINNSGKETKDTKQ